MTDDDDDDCGPEIADLYNTETLRVMAHREALRRPDFDEFTTRVIAMVQLVESQKRSAQMLNDALESICERCQERCPHRPCDPELS